MKISDLSDKLKRIEDEITKASKCTRIKDKSIFAMYAGIIVEMMIRCIFRGTEEYDGLPENDIMIKMKHSSQLLQDLHNKGHIKTEVYMMMNTIMIYRKYSEHNINFKYDYYDVCMPMFVRILKWFYTDYLSMNDKFMQLKSKICNEDTEYLITEELGKYRTNETANIHHITEIAVRMNTKLISAS